MIWIVSNFLNPYYSIPLWLILFFHKKRSLFDYFSIVVCSEIFPGIDTLSLGVMSNIQFISIFILIQSLFNTSQKNVLKVRSSNYFFLIIFSTYCFISFALSFYNEGITKAPLNWIINTLIVLLTFKGSQKELIFFSKLFVFCVLVVVIETLVMRIIFFNDLTLFKLYSIANVNHIGFLALSAVALITFLFSIQPLKIYKKSFFILTFFIFFTGGRLNFFLFLIFLLIHLNRPFNNFFLSRKTIIIISFGITLLFSGVITDSIFRDSKSSEVSFEINSVDDLNNKTLNKFASGRGELYVNGINMFMLNPIFGNGFLSWTAKTNIHNSWISRKGERVSMHSTLIQYLTEIGLVGLAFYLFYLFKIFSFGKYISKKSSIEYRDFGRVISLFSIFIFLGGLLDNHSMAFTPLHFIFGLAIYLKNN